MPLPFDCEGKGVLELVPDSSSSSLSPSSNPLLSKDGTRKGVVFRVVSLRSRFPFETLALLLLQPYFLLRSGRRRWWWWVYRPAEVAAVSGNPSLTWLPAQQEAVCSNVGIESGCGSSELQPVPPALEIGSRTATGTEKCGLRMEDWERMLPESQGATLSEDQSILRWIIGDAADFEFIRGFGVVDQISGLHPVGSVASSVGNSMGFSSINPSLPPTPEFHQAPNKFNNEKLGFSPYPSILPNFKLSNPPSTMFSPLSNDLLPISLSSQCQQPVECVDVKPQIFNPHSLINHHHDQHPQIPSFSLPLSHTQQEHSLILEPNTSIPRSPASDSILNQQPQGVPHHHQFLPHYLQQKPTTLGMKPKMAGDEMGHPQQQVIVDQLYKSAELVQWGNSVLAQEILARLNHQLSPVGNPFHRAAFFCKEALQLLLHTNSNSTNTPVADHSSPFNVISKISAYKSFSEISPVLQFANFTCNQAILEALQGFDRVHIIDFDIGYGGQWASLMQELALRSGGAPSLKITAFASPSTHDWLELGLAKENLNLFAGEINMAFEFEILSFDSLNSGSWPLPSLAFENEAVAVNLPVGSFSNYQLSFPLILGFVKQLSPKIVVSVDRGCDQTDLPFPNLVIHALHSYSNLLESFDAVNVNLDALQKIERFLLQPRIEKIVMGHYRSPEKMAYWRTLFFSSGFSPLTFSSFTESQAECVIKRTPVRGFHVEKKQSSLSLCWQQKELVSASAWRC